MKPWVFRAADVLARPVGPLDVGVVLFLSLLPLALTPAIPSIDFYGHVLRYDVLATGGSSEAIAASYRPAWALLPNLGLDILGAALLKIMPPLAGGKLIAAMVAVAPFLGVLALARALGGRVEFHQLLLAAILIFSHIYVWGFSNFLFGFGLALGALALWIALEDRPSRQLGAAILLAPVLLIVHALAFAVFGLLLALVELAAAMAERRLNTRALVVRGARLAAVAALPIVLFLLSRTTEAADGITGSFNRLAAIQAQGALGPRLVAEIGSRIDTLLRVADSTFADADRLLGLLLWAGLGLALARRILVLDRRLALAVPVVLVAVALTPPVLFGVGYVDDRLPLVLLALLAAGTRLDPELPAAKPLVAGLGVLFLVRLMLVAAAHGKAGVIYEDYLARIRDLPTGQTAVLLRGTGVERDGDQPFCSPLGPLLAFRNGTAVPTWANRSQQPIEVIGPMARAMEVRRQRRASRPSGRDETVAGLLEAGFDTVIYCTRGPGPPLEPGVRLLAEGTLWRVFGRAAPGSASARPPG